MRYETKFVWGKSADGGTRWTPVWLHMRDTAEVAAALWDGWVAPHIKQIIARDLKLSETEAEVFVSWVAGMHDIAKALPDFSGRDTVTVMTQPLYKRMRDVGFAYPADINNSHHSTSGTVVLSVFCGKDADEDALESVAAIIAGHHGRPIYPEHGSHGRVSRLDQIWLDAMNDLTDFIFDVVPDSERVLAHVKMLGVTRRAQVLVTSLVIMSDWIASNEKHFPLLDFDDVPEIDADYDQERTNTALRSLELPPLIDGGKTPLPVDFTELFEHRFDISGAQLRPVQEELLALVSDPSQDPNDIFILEAPMGEGKTEAALLAAEVLMRRSGMSGFYFALPTMATGEAIYKRTLPYIESLLQESGQAASVSLLHSKANISTAYAQARYTAWKNRTEVGIISEGWLGTPRLKMVNAFSVGTIDRFLMLSLKAKYAYWLHLGCASKVIIIDEVHSADAYMTTYLKQSLAIAGFYEVPVILLSATLPSSTRDELIAAYALGKKEAGKIV